MHKLAVVLFLLAAHFVLAQQRLAITVDDLPFVTIDDDHSLQNVSHARDATSKLLNVLKAHHAAAIGFVNEVNVQVSGQRDSRTAILQSWLDSGMDLGNHTYSHVALSKSDLREYQDEVVRGSVVTSSLLSAKGKSEKFFRYPFNDTGGPDKKQPFLDFLAERKMRIAPFTIEASDYIFNELYVKAQRSGDTEKAQRIRTAYLAYTDVQFEFFENLSAHLFGRNIPQILLFHANDINADSLDEMLSRLERRGYRLVELSDVLKDSAYNTSDTYTGRFGISWLHRWSAALGHPSELKAEPDPPSWVLDAYKELGH